LLTSESHGSSVSIVTAPRARRGTKSDPISSRARVLFLLAGYKPDYEVLGSGIADDTEPLAFHGVIGFPSSEVM